MYDLETQCLCVCVCVFVCYIARRGVSGRQEMDRKKSRGEGILSGIKGVAFGL